MDVIYFIKEGDTARRIDSMMVEPMRNAGYTIMRMALDGKNEMVELKPEEDMPEGFLQESRYGMVLIMNPGGVKKDAEKDDLRAEVEALKQEIAELKKGGDRQ